MEKEIEINGIKYIPKDSANYKMVEKNKKGLTYSIIRTYSAGVFAGWIDRKVKGKENTIYDSRRIWYWDGASSLSQMAVDGVSKPESCKFSKLVPEIDLKEIIEVLPCTEKARKNIGDVPIWQN